jgi:hypothetical protein
MNSKKANDWTDYLEGDFRTEFIENIRSLSFDKIQKYPPPKKGGLPLGHETRIFRRFLSGKSSLLDLSIFSGLYLAVASKRQRLLHSIFVQGEAAPKEDWGDLFGSKVINDWIENNLLKFSGDKIVSSFRLISIDGIVLLVDPFPDPFPNRVHIGQDTLNLIEFLSLKQFSNKNLYLDVGTGSGAVLLTQNDKYKEAIGIDINPRALRLSKLNIELNQKTFCKIYKQDALTLNDNYGLFDLITWNVPFIFFPEDQKESNIDGYGGDMGIELTLKFVERIPTLLAEDGSCYLLSSAPILSNGHNVMVEQITSLAKRLELDIEVFPLQSFWMPNLKNFYKKHNIDRFESIILKIIIGNGTIKINSLSVMESITDRIRRVLYGFRPLGPLQ